MELREFVALTLVHIQGGVADAAAQAKSLGLPGVINPVWGTVDDAGPGEVQKVQFDIAVTVTNKKSGGVDGTLSVLSAKVSGSKGGAQENSASSRIQFSVPVVPPVTTVARKGGNAPPA